MISVQQLVVVHGVAFAALVAAHLLWLMRRAAACRWRWRVVFLLGAGLLLALASVLAMLLSAYAMGGAMALLGSLGGLRDEASLLAWASPVGLLLAAAPMTLAVRVAAAGLRRWVRPADVR